MLLETTYAGSVALINCKAGQQEHRLRESWGQIAALPLTCGVASASPFTSPSFGFLICTAE